MADTRYLRQRHQGWYFVAAVPRALRGKFLPGNGILPAETNAWQKTSEVRSDLQRQMDRTQRRRFAAIRREAGKSQLAKDRLVGPGALAPMLIVLVIF
jgi:hypothetical protein